MSYLTLYARVPPRSPADQGARVDEQTLLNRRKFYGGAHVRVFVEDTSAAAMRRAPTAVAAAEAPDRRLLERDQPRVLGRLAGVARELAAQDRHAARALQRFRGGLACGGRALRIECENRPP